MQVFNQTHAFIWDELHINNCNTYLINGPVPVLIDPGHIAYIDNVIKQLKKQQLKMEDIQIVLCTHGHPDHLESIQLFKETGAKTGLHEADWKLLKNMKKYIMGTTDMDIELLRPDFFIQPGKLNFSGTDLEVFHTPGHSPGSICIYQADDKALFTGDLIFKDGVGRTDLPGGNGSTLKNSIKQLMDLEVDYLLPGHGEIITGKEQIRLNFHEIEKFWFQFV